MTKLLKFGKNNAKLKSGVVTFSLPAGWSCPGAKSCKAIADRLTGKISDGEELEYRCFAASDEARLPTVRKARWHNYDLLIKARTEENMLGLLLNSIPAGQHVFRIHVSGDFFSRAYLRAWLGVMAQTPGSRYYAYTKSLKLVMDHLSTAGTWAENFQLVASRGGKHDSLIPAAKAAFDSIGLRLGTSVVLGHPEEAAALGLTVDHDDSHAMSGDDFSLLLHGTQPKGSSASEAIKRLKSEGVKFSYSA